MSELTSPQSLSGAGVPAATTTATAAVLTREQIVPSRARVKLPPWLEKIGRAHV